MSFLFLRVGIKRHVTSASHQKEPQRTGPRSQPNCDLSIYFLYHLLISIEVYIYIYVVCYSLPKDFRYTRALSTWFLAPFNPIPNHFHVISKPLFLPPLVHPQHPPFEPEKPTNDFGQEILTTTLNTLNQRLLEFSQIFPICKLLVFFPKKNPVKKLPALDRFPNNKGLWHLSVGDDFNQPRSHLKKFHRSISSNRHRNMVD